jgi:hypothetical protein
VYMRFNTGGLLRGSLKEQYEAHSIALAKQPFMTQDEVRGLQELAPLGGAAAELGVGLGATNVGSNSDEPPAEDSESRGIIDLQRTFCPDCDAWLGRGVKGAVWCRRCRAEKTFA